MFIGGLDYNDRLDGASTPGRAAVSPSGDDDMRYLWTDDALPVTPAFLKNQLKYEKPRAQVVCVCVCLCVNLLQHVLLLPVQYVTVVQQ